MVRIRDRKNVSIQFQTLQKVIPIFWIEIIFQTAKMCQWFLGINPCRCRKVTGTVRQKLRLCWGLKKCDQSRAWGCIFSHTGWWSRVFCSTFHARSKRRTKESHASCHRPRSSPVRNKNCFSCCSCFSDSETSVQCCWPCNEKQSWNF